MIKNKRIALIFGEYNHPVQPYLTSWAECLKEYYPVSIYSVSSPKQVQHPDLVLLSAKNKFEKICRGIKLLKEHPSQTINWLNSTKTSSLQKRLDDWAIYGTLITRGHCIIHLVNSYIYPKLSHTVRKSGAKSIISFRGYDTVVRPFADDEWKNTLLNIYQEADCLHFVSSYLRDEAIKLGAPPEKCVVIYPGVDTEYFKQAVKEIKLFQKNHLTLITTGRLTWQKGYLFMLLAVKKLKSMGFPVKYRIVGDGVDWEQLVFWVRELDLQNEVELLRQRTSAEIRVLLSSSDIYIQPSISEALGVSIVEALAIGIPVIATNVGGIPEIINDGETGILVPPGDSNALIDAIMELRQDPIKAQKFVDNGRRLVEHKFSLMREIQEWNKLYKDL